MNDFGFKVRHCEVCDNSNDEGGKQDGIFCAE